MSLKIGPIENYSIDFEPLSRLEIDIIRNNQKIQIFSICRKRLILPPNKPIRNNLN